MKDLLSYVGIHWVTATIIVQEITGVPENTIFLAAQPVLHCVLHYTPLQHNMLCQLFELSEIGRNFYLEAKVKFRHPKLQKLK